MKYLLCLPFLLCSCVTSGDFRALADEVGKIEAVAMDSTKTSVDLQDQINASGDAINQLADTVEERTASVVAGLTQGEAGGVAGILAALGIHFYRNSQRKKRGEPTG